MSFFLYIIWFVLFFNFVGLIWVQNFPLRKLKRYIFRVTSWKNNMFGMTLRFFTMDTTAFFEMMIVYWQKSMKRKKLSEKPFADPRVIAKPVCFAEPEDIAVHVSRYLRDRWGLQEPKKPTKVVFTLFVHFISNVCNFNSTPKISVLSVCFHP